ncbi:cytidylyltransferase domain-containing protein [Candidatus Altiarchaeota archaeon]
MMKTGVTITIRLKSQRLPRKVILPISGRPMVEHLIERLKTARLPDTIVLCTSTNPQDDELIPYAERTGISYFRGDEDDVLKRLLDAALRDGLDFIVSTTGDNPLTDPGYIDKTIERYKETDADYIYCPDLPFGTFSYGIKVDALRKVVGMKKERDTEIWGHYFKDSGQFHVEKLEPEECLRRPDIRLTVDEPVDYDLMKKIVFYYLLPGLKQVIGLLDEDPSLAEMNKGVVQRQAEVKEVLVEEDDQDS